MLYIDYKQVEISKQQIDVCPHKKQNGEGYDINVYIEFNKSEKKGYLNLSAGFEKEKNIDKFINKKYSGIPFEKTINLLEIYDVKDVFDIQIESPIILDLKSIKNNQVET